MFCLNQINVSLSKSKSAQKFKHEFCRRTGFQPFRVQSRTPFDLILTLRDFIYQPKITFIQKPQFSNKINILFYFLILLSVFPSCTVLQKQAKMAVELKGEQVFEKNKSFQGLKVGGLSELFFDESSGHFFALSDDKKNHRFYKLALKTKPNYQLEIKEQIFLKSPGHKRLKRNMDPEALALYGEDKIFIASEGQQIYKIHEPTQIFTFDRKGVLQEAWPVPAVFWPAGQVKQSPSFGQQENKGFESLTLDKKSNTLWTATEQPLKQDLTFKNKFFVRLSAFDIKSKKMLIQYPYALKNGKGGLVALKWIKPKIFIGLERTYKKQKNNGINEVDLFLIDCRQASYVQTQIQLKKNFKACLKYQLWSSLKNLSGSQVDNLEALALGPVLPSKKQLMILASDNNFNEEKQKTQFLFFELSIPK